MWKLRRQTTTTTTNTVTSIATTVVVVLLCLCSCDVQAFTSPTTRSIPVKSSCFSPSISQDRATTTTTSTFMIGGEQLLVETATTATTAPLITDIASLFSTTELVSFADQGQNLAGIFFQSSLLPYLAYLYFIGYKKNRVPALSNFGLQFILVFVASTIPSGLISKANYGVTLANCDWLHGSSEFLLTAANVLLVLGLKDANQNAAATAGTNGGGTTTATINDTNDNDNDNQLLLGRVAGFGSFGIFVAACFLGPSTFGAHTPFLSGIGDLPSSISSSLPWAAQHADPVNALSIPTWIIHYSSVLEFIVAMRLVWEYSKVTNNETWKGLTWGMLPLHASGVCACTYHLFYNNMQFLVTLQAGFTALGNLTCAIAAYRIAISNGWTLQQLNPLNKESSSSTTTTEKIITSKSTTAAAAIMMDETTTAQESNVVLFGKIAATTIALSYVTKYGELAVDFPFSVNPPLALAIVLLIPALTALPYLQESGTIPKSGDFSMDDVKKYGIAGTIAYILTELAFWAVAFPVASYALYQTSGHWPDVINDTTDRATVLGFIFAGANVARLLVPLRFGAALALAPWVDENLINKNEEE